MKDSLRLSPLRHTWIIDLDGTLVEHNGYKTGRDSWLPGALEFLRSIPDGDAVIFLTAREEAARPATEDFLSRHGVAYKAIHFEMPMGERILINDDKPSGLPCAHSVRLTRNSGPGGLNFVIDPEL